MPILMRNAAAASLRRLRPCVLHGGRRGLTKKAAAPVTEVVRDVCIIGSGPAGYTAALYAARANRNPLVIAGYQHGGQLMLTSDVENFPGYREPVPGPDLMEDLRQQAERFGAEVVHRNADALDASTRPFRISMRGGKMQVLANSVIVSTGAEAQWLGAQNEELVKGAGVSTCATCDGAFYEGKEVLMVGGGDSAITEALFLTRFASKVTIVHRREGFRASPIMLERARTHPKIHILTNKVVKRWLVETPPPSQGEGGGAGAAVLRGAEVTDVVTGEAMELPAAGAFLAVGHKPVTKFLKGSGVELDAEGYIVNRKHTMTSVEGVFACGDVVDKRYRQAITAAGMGCQAAMDAEKWLEGEPF